MVGILIVGIMLFPLVSLLIGSFQFIGQSHVQTSVA